MKYAAIILLLILSSCYTRKVAQKQFARSTTNFPEIGAEFCAITYPPRNTVTKGDTVTVTDTIFTGGSTSFDTTIVMDTKYITKTIQLPGTRIVERYYIHDTIMQVNDAEVRLWQIRTGEALSISTAKTKEADHWRVTAKKRFWIILGLGAAIALGIVAMIRRRFTKK